MGASPIFRLRTLGGLTLERCEPAPGASPPGVVRAQRKTLAILALLAAARGRGVSRDRLLLYFWPESDEDRSRGALKQALHTLRRQLGSSEVLAGSTELHLEPSIIESDVAQYLDALERNDLRTAVALYGGPFLDGFHIRGAAEFSRWADSIRDELAHRNSLALEQLAQQAAARGDHDEAVEWWRRIVSSDPLSTRATVGLMRALDAAGQRAAAIRCAQLHEALLRKEMESDPDPSVTEYAAELKESVAAAPPVPAARYAPALPAADPLPEASKVPGNVRVHRRLALTLAALTVFVAGLVAIFVAAPTRPSAAADRVDPVAYESYLQGRHHWRQRTPESLLAAVRHYEAAIERAPRYARAWAGLAEAYLNISNFGLRDSEEALNLAERAADRALELEQGLVEAHAVKGYALASRLAYEDAENSFRRAIAIDDSYTWSHHFYTLLLMMRGRTAEALEHNRAAIRTDALSRPATATTGIILAQTGDLQGAIAALERALSLGQEFQLTLFYLGAARLAEGSVQQAITHLERVSRIAPAFTGVPGALALAYRQAGREAAADSILHTLRADSSSARARVNLGFAEAALGNHDRAFALLEDARWDVPSVIELRADPLLAAFRSDPRYAPLIARISAGSQPHTPGR